MSKLMDSEYLLTKAYQNSANLMARSDIHTRFSENRYGWQRWLFDHLTLPTNSRILELGCGIGSLWLENADRIPEGWNITLSDFSSGMIQDARNNLSNVTHSFKFEQFDAQTIPYKDATLDVVIANNMLYHVPDINACLTEIRRVLRPNGRLYASTFGRDHLKELGAIVRKLWPQLPPSSGAGATRFGLENGAALLSPWFNHVMVYHYPDALLITEIEPVVDWYRAIPMRDKVTDFTACIEHELTTYGTLRVTKSMGVFEAYI